MQLSPLPALPACATSKLAGGKEPVERCTPALRSTSRPGAGYSCPRFAPPVGSARPIGAVGESKLHLRYMAKELNLVMVPPLAGGEGTVELFQNPLTTTGQATTPLAAEDAGPDVLVEDGKAVVKVDKADLYRLVNNREIDTYDLTLSTTSDGLAIYAFTFTSCLAHEAARSTSSQADKPRDQSIDRGCDERGNLRSPGPSLTGSRTQYHLY